MQIKTINSGENAGTTYYVDDNGNFAGLATHSNPAVSQEQITATHTQPEAIATFKAQPDYNENKVAPVVNPAYDASKDPVVNPAYDASKDLDGDGALSLEEQGATSYDDTTKTYTMADGTTKTLTTPPVTNTQFDTSTTVNPVYDASKDTNNDGAITLEELGATSYDDNTKTYTMADGTTKTQQDLITATGTGTGQYTGPNVDGTAGYSDSSNSNINPETGEVFYGEALTNDANTTGTDTTGTGTDTGNVTPTSAITPTPVTQISDAQVTAGSIATTAGQIAGVTPTAGVASTVSDENKVTTPETVTANTYNADTAQTESQAELDKVNAATIDTTGGLPTGATVTGQTLASQQPPVTTQPIAKDVGDLVKQKASADSGLRQIGLDAAQIDEAQTVKAPAPLTATQTTADVQGDLLDTSVSSVDQTKVDEAFGTGRVTAATATPTAEATVAGQLEKLTANYDLSNPPPYAAGAIRAANAQLSARGLSASSMAGQAILQASLEAALPIAQADAAITSQFEMQNLSNRQQVAMFGAQQRANFLELEFNQDFQMRVSNASRIADIANINFSAEQQIALENSRMAQSVDLANLGNRQAKVMADAAALTNLDMAELNNRQQAAVLNAQNFLQIEMANLTNEQQTSMFKAQAIQQAILSDSAATNAQLQFNASSENQVDMFMANLAVDVSKANADIAMYNAGEENKFAVFNAELAERREQFNAQNGLIIAQANAAWRQATTTSNNATQNEANRIDAAASTGMTRAQMDEYWQSERDKIAYAFGTLESEKDRLANIYIAEMGADKAADYADNKATGSFWSSIALAYIKKTFNLDIK